MRPLKILLISMMLLTTGAGFAVGEDHAAIRRHAQKQYSDGNYKDALLLFQRLCLEVENDPKLVGADLTQAWQSLQQLDRLSELDEFREQVIARHAGNWRLLLAAAQTYSHNNHWGFMLAGEFERGSHRGGGQSVNAIKRDRTRALQLMQQARGLAEEDPAKGEVAHYYLAFGQMLNQFNGQSNSWRLLTLTDLEALPDYEPGYGYEYGGGPAGASVDAGGQPIFHNLPRSWESAETDGERWRWVNQRAVELAPNLEAQVLYAYATFLHQQFGVQTMAQYGPFFGWGRPVAEDQAKDPGAAAYAVHTLTDSETIAKLAVGVKRFSLPDGHNYIKIFEEIAGRPDQGYADNAIQVLAQIYENRKQYDRAVLYWKEYEQYNRKYAHERISQIMDNWGRFEPVGTQAAHQHPKVEYRFRNAQLVSFRAHRIRVPRLLDDIKAYIRSRPRHLDWNQLNPNNIGWRLVQDDQIRYLGSEVASWSLKLEPDQRHWDRRVSVHLPEALNQAGAYLLVANLEDGNTARIIIWVSDAAIVKKPVQKKGFYYIADAVTGMPLANTPVEFFGYRSQRISGTKRYSIQHLTITRRTDTDGQIFLDPEEMPANLQWLVTAGDGKQRLAFLGFSNVWYPEHHDRAYHQTKTLILTDRPVYRPQQTVQFKMWLRMAQYDLKDSSVFAGNSVQVRIHNPKNEQVYARTLTADEFGGVADELVLPVDAPLGVYRISHTGGGLYGGQTFRVEEYKKPEFEVKIEAPDQPVMLGEKITAVIKADYYFGAPVTEATVSYKVLRSAHDSRWYPRLYWDWFYGPGYWWFGYDYSWYPGWEMWGCRKPLWTWWPQAPERQPEVVADGVAQIQQDGTVRIDIDTGLAKLIHGDSDHRYTIQAEVRDLSRRTIAAKG